MAIGNKTSGIRELLPELMGGVGSNLVRQDPARPHTNWLRPVQASTGVRSTYVIPGDWPGKPDDWFASDAPTYPMRKQNNVEYFIDGEPTFEAMVEAIETASGPDHFIVLLGWACHVDFVLSKSGNRCPGAQRTFFDIIKERVEKGVLVRVLLYYNSPSDPDFVGNSLEWHTKKAFDSLEIEHPAPPAVSKIRCILDNGIKVAGGLGHARSSHHQKVLLVYGSEGLVGFFGGVDVNSDRVNPGRLRTLAGPEWVDPHGPLHDVHVRVTGEAADDLMVLATNRWNFAVPFAGTPEIERGRTGPLTHSQAVSYPSGRAIEDMNILLNRARQKPAAPPGPHHVLKIAQTVGNPALAKLQDNGVWPMVRHAIQQAKKFIYMEDQYLWSVEAAEELGRAAARLAYVTILMPPDDQMPPGGTAARYRALKRMKEVAGADAAKIRIYLIREAVHQYIHAKMWIFDDECTIIGSANCNNRGYFTDSEVNGTIADPEWESKAGPRGGQWWALDLNLAHKLRIQLWAEHLRLPEDCLNDGVAAEIHWRSPPSNARITPYTIAARVSGESRVCLWHEYPYVEYEDYGNLTIADPKI